jgi:hypothetical protein
MAAKPMGIKKKGRQPSPVTAPVEVFFTNV